MMQDRLRTLKLTTELPGYDVSPLVEASVDGKNRSRVAATLNDRLSLVGSSDKDGVSLVVTNGETGRILL